MLDWILCCCNSEKAPVINTHQNGTQAATATTNTAVQAVAQPQMQNAPTLSRPKSATHKRIDTSAANLLSALTPSIQEEIANGTNTKVTPISLTAQKIEFKNFVSHVSDPSKVFQGIVVEMNSLKQYNDNPLEMYFLCSTDLKILLVTRNVLTTFSDVPGRFLNQNLKEFIGNNKGEAFAKEVGSITANSSTAQRLTHLRINQDKTIDCKYTIPKKWTDKYLLFKFILSNRDDAINKEDHHSPNVSAACTPSATTASAIRINIAPPASARSSANKNTVFVSGAMTHRSEQRSSDNIVTSRSAPTSTRDKVGVHVNTDTLHLPLPGRKAMDTDHSVMRAASPSNSPTQVPLRPVPPFDSIEASNLFQPPNFILLSPPTDHLPTASTPTAPFPSPTTSQPADNFSFLEHKPQQPNNRLLTTTLQASSADLKSD